MSRIDWVRWGMRGARAVWRFSRQRGGTSRALATTEAADGTAPRTAITTMTTAAATAMGWARAAETYHFDLSDRRLDRTLLYIHAEHAQIVIQRHDAPNIQIEARLIAPMAWRITAEQDAAGVYLVALRRPIISAIAGAVFTVRVPSMMAVSLKLKHADLMQHDLSGDMTIPPERR